mgnify:FL=1
MYKRQVCFCFCDNVTQLAVVCRIRSALFDSDYDLTADDGKDFTELKHIEHKVVKDDKVTFTNFGWEGNAKGRYVRYQATSGEFGGFLFTDEVVIK